MEGNYLQFNELLRSAYEAEMLLAAVGIVVLSAAAIYALVSKMPNLLIVIGIGAIILSLFCVFSMRPLKKDMEKTSYCVYEGDFYVESYFGMSNGKAFILIRTEDASKSIRYQVLCGQLQVSDDATYNGSFVYGKNSKCIVDFSINGDTSASES